MAQRWENQQSRRQEQELYRLESARRSQEKVARQQEKLARRIAQQQADAQADMDRTLRYLIQSQGSSPLWTGNSGFGSYQSVSVELVRGMGPFPSLPCFIMKAVPMAVAKADRERPRQKDWPQEDGGYY
jgi:hypothetical protein